MIFKTFLALIIVTANVLYSTPGHVLRDDGSYSILTEGSYTHGCIVNAPCAMGGTGMVVWEGESGNYKLFDSNGDLIFTNGLYYETFNGDAKFFEDGSYSFMTQDGRFVRGCVINSPCDESADPTVQSFKFFADGSWEIVYFDGQTETNSVLRELH